jgi:tetratricopeptide (TPR) repeat protein
MRCWSELRVFLLLGLAIATTKCSQDANTRKQKYLESGQRYFDKGKYREAAIQFSNAIQIDSTYAHAHYELAKTELKLQQWAEAYQGLSRVLDLPTYLPRLENQPCSVEQFVWAYYQKGSFKSAIDLFQEALRLAEQSRNPSNPNIHYYLALAYEKLGHSGLAKGAVSKGA